MLKKLLLLGLKLLHRNVVEKPLINEVRPDIYSYVIKRYGGRHHGQVLDRSTRSLGVALNWQLVIANRLMNATSELRGYLGQTERYYEFEVEVQLLYPEGNIPSDTVLDLESLGRAFEQVDDRWRYDIVGRVITLSFVEAPEIDMGPVVRVA